MKKFIFTFLLASIITNVFSQNTDIKAILLSELEKLESVKGKYYVYTLTDLKNASEAIPLLDSRIELTNVISIPNRKKTELYDNALKYIGKSYVSAKTVIDVKDKDAGIIVYKPIVTGKYLAKDKLMTYRGTEPLHCTVMLEFRDERYKITISNLHTSKGELLDQEIPFELFMTESFYDKRPNRDPLNYRGRAHYQNLRTQLVLTQLYQLFALQDEIQDYLSSIESEESW